MLLFEMLRALMVLVLWSLTWLLSCGGPFSAVGEKRHSFDVGTIS